MQKDIISIGVFNRIEIWSKEKWDAYNDSENFINNELAAKMAELGI
jgi:MraZ protein